MFVELFTELIRLLSMFFSRLYKFFRNCAKIFDLIVIKYDFFIRELQLLHNNVSHWGKKQQKIFTAKKTAN